MGEARWLTVVSPEGPEDIELLLEPNDNPVAKTYQKAIFKQGIPATAFSAEDIQKEYERMKKLGVTFTREPMKEEPLTQAVFDDTCGNLIQIYQAGVSPRQSKDKGTLQSPYTSAETNAQAPEQPPTPNPALKRLDVFVGKWNTEGQTWATLSNPAAKITGMDTYEWLEGGFFLVHHVDVRIDDEEIKTIEIIGYDATSQTYPMRYFDNQGNFGTYQASVRNGIWTFTGESERSTVVFSDGGNTITANWKHSSDGSNWLPLMEVRLTKVEDLIAHPLYTVSSAQNKKTAGIYASVNGLNMYYEIYGTGRPLVLLHGALTTIDTSFGKILPYLAKTRQIIAIEQQAHGHTADIDRPLTYEHMADDTVSLLGQIKVKNADFFGYSMGADVALQIAIRYPELVRKLVVASTAYNSSGLYPEVLEGEENMRPEDLTGSEWQKAYTKVAPNPKNWPKLIERVKQLDREFKDWLPEDIRGIKAPTLVVIGDSDIIRPEHAVQMFRLLGGGVAGDLAGLPRSQLAVLPGTTHVTLVNRADWLVSIIGEFLDAPI